MAAQGGTFQILRAVRSARSGRWDWQFPSGACASGTFQADKCDTFRLTVHVQRLRNIPGTAATWTVVRTHTSPPRLSRVSTTWRSNSLTTMWRYESRTRIGAPGHELDIRNREKHLLTQESSRREALLLSRIFDEGLLVVQPAVLFCLLGPRRT
jgi:hypothetical protein